MFRNANFGLLASDGTRLFVIEDDAMIMHGPGGSGFQPIVEGPEGERTMRPGNRLAAYDLSTGREVWSLGGQANGESFDLPLAGSFFFGAPLVDGGELYIVGERDLDVRLYAIDPESGAVRWSQLLAHSDNKIEQELGRRWRTAQVASSDGILVCPTTVDWLVGVDRLDHSVLWMHRYSSPRPQVERREREQGDTMVQPTELNGQWCPSAPVIAGNRVLYTPAEEPNLICLDLATGTLRWRFPRGDDQLYLAGLHEYVGHRRRQIVGDGDRDRHGQGPMDHVHRRIAGPAQRPRRPVVRAFLPAAPGGSLCTIELNRGRIVETVQLLPGSRPLGNLTLYRGMMLSLNAYGLTSFEQRDAIERQIAQRQTTDPHDEWASVKRAEIALLHNDPAPPSNRWTGSTRGISRRFWPDRIAVALSRGADRCDSSRLHDERTIPRAALGPRANGGRAALGRTARSGTRSGRRQVRRRIRRVAETGADGTPGRDDSPHGRSARYR